MTSAVDSPDDDDNDDEIERFAGVLSQSDAIVYASDILYKPKPNLLVYLNAESLDQRSWDGFRFATQKAEPAPLRPHPYSTGLDMLLPAFLIEVKTGMVANDVIAVHNQAAVGTVGCLCIVKGVCDWFEERGIRNTGIQNAVFFSIVTHAQVHELRITYKHDGVHHYVCLDIAAAYNQAWSEKVIGWIDALLAMGLDQRKAMIQALEEFGSQIPIDTST